MVTNSKRTPLSALVEIKALYNWWVDLRVGRTDAWRDIDTTQPV